MAVRKTFFLRDDDVAEADPAFLRVFKFLLGVRVPTVYAVIPAKIKPGLTHLLTGHPEAGRLFETAQHGLCHCDHSGNTYLRQEFGPSRAFSRQLADIRTGRDLMKKEFGRLFIPVFVPPFHMYNSDTVKAAVKAGLTAFSASKSIGAIHGSGLVFLPAQVNVNEYDLALKAVPLEIKKLKEKTLKALRTPGMTAGIYFHHSDLKRRNLEVFENYIIFLKELASRRWIELALFSSILRKTKNA